MDYITAQEAEEQLGISADALSYAATLNLIKAIKEPAGEVDFGTYKMQSYILKFKRDDVIALIKSLKEA